MSSQQQPKTIWIGETAPTPLGPLWAAVSEKGLWAVSYDIPREQFEAAVLERGAAQIHYAPERTAAALQQLGEFLAGARKTFSLAVDWTGMTDFQIEVRRATMAIPYGEVSSYGEVAAQVGRPRAARAVGGVQASNPISFVIPCHRVLGADGSLHGYGGSGGLRTKAWLLELERQQHILDKTI